MPTTILLKLIPVVIGIVVICILMSGYVKAPTDMAFIISGIRKEPKILIGRAGIKIPFLERKDTLLLKQIAIDIKSEGFIPTQDFIGVDVDAVAKIKIMTDSEGIKLAQRNFLNMNEEEIIHALVDSLQGNMREIIGTITLKEICNDRKRFGDEVQAKAQKDMNALGVEIISCNIQRVTDKENLIPALGQDNMSKIKKDASIAKAEADRDVAIAEAEAKKAANDAQVEAETQIAIRNTELAIKEAELKQQADIKKAAADSAYSIQEQEQRKAIEIATQNANIAKQEKEIELKQREVKITEQQLEASIKRKAEADKYAAQQKAEAQLFERQRIAEAELFETQKAAEAQKAEAEAERYKKEQEAIGIQKVGEAEAEAIRAKGMAEAEAMDKKAEAYKKFNNAAVAQMLIEVLPDIAGKIAEPLTKIDKITIIGGGDGNGLDAVAGNVPAVMTKVFEAMKETVGIDMSELVKAQTYDAKVNRNLHITGLENPAQPKENITDEVIQKENPEL